MKMTNYLKISSRGAKKPLAYLKKQNKFDFDVKL
jgi:hypothetical protein